MAETRGSYTPQKIEKVTSLGVGKHSAVRFDELHWQALVGANEVLGIIMNKRCIRIKCVHDTIPLCGFQSLCLRW